jgi:trimeric autotransporter adhesin
MNFRGFIKRLSFFTIAAYFVMITSTSAWGQTIVFQDDFSTNTSITYTTAGAINGSAFNVTRSGTDWGARRNTSPAQMELTNDASAAGNANGWVFASTATGSFSSPYNTTLSSNPGQVTWTFNMRQIRTDPAGFNTTSSYGLAFILGTTSTTASNNGNGYAVVLGGGSATDPIRLVRFTIGLQGTINDIISSNTPGLTDFGTDYLSIKVTYNPSNNQWELFLRNDGATAFADPSTGTLVSQGTATDTTYTNTPLTALGGYWQGSTASDQPAFFDNIRVAVMSSTAASVSVGGQIREANGRGVFRARVTMTDLDGNVRTTYTNQFGYYRFEEVPAGQDYIFAASHIRYQFTQPTLIRFIGEDTEGINFVTAGAGSNSSAPD